MPLGFAAPVVQLLLHLHPPVLEPDLYLAVCQVEALADLQAALSGQVHVEQEFFLKLQSLLLGVRRALLPVDSGRQPCADGRAVSSRDLAPMTGLIWREPEADRQRSYFYRLHYNSPSAGNI